MFLLSCCYILLVTDTNGTVLFPKSIRLTMKQMNKRSWCRWSMWGCHRDLENRDLTEMGATKKISKSTRRMSYVSKDKKEFSGKDKGWQHPRHRNQQLESTWYFKGTLKCFCGWSKRFSYKTKEIGWDQIMRGLVNKEEMFILCWKQWEPVKRF